MNRLPIAYTRGEYDLQKLWIEFNALWVRATPTSLFVCLFTYFFIHLFIHLFVDISIPHNISISRAVITDTFIFCLGVLEAGVTGWYVSRVSRLAGSTGSSTYKLRDGTVLCFVGGALSVLFALIVFIHRCEIPEPVTPPVRYQHSHQTDAQQQMLPSPQ